MSRIDASERLILALDLPVLEKAVELIEKLDGLVSIFKINYQLILAGADKKFREDLISQGKELFIDLKFEDTYNTVTGYIRELSKEQVKFCTVHGNSETMKAAVAGRNGNNDLKILIVTVLTSLDSHDLQDLYHSDKTINLEDLVLYRAFKALELGCDGVIASGRETQRIKEQFGNKLQIVTPGIRLNSANHDDHKRVATPEEAITAGADYLVVGRPIYNAPDQVDATNRILDRMQKAFDARS